MAKRPLGFRRPRKSRNIGWVAVYILLVLSCGGIAVVTGVIDKSDEEHVMVGRKLMQVSTNNTNSTATPMPTNATDDSSDDSPYPKVFFSEQDMRNGGKVLCLAGMLYMFAALAIVCDDYFVAALDVIIEVLDLSEDVAGATFMAAGGSAPELFTSIIGVFVAESNVGFGTIVGSAVFNILFVIGCCAVATQSLDPNGLPLTWWPLFRDSSFYTTALLLLAMFFWDKSIKLWESCILLTCYFCYVGFMKYNSTVRKRAWEVAGMKWKELSAELSSSREMVEKGDDTSSGENDEEEDEFWTPSWPSDGTCWEKFKFVFFFPLNFVLWLTVPNCAREEKKKWYPLGFILSIFWIAFFSYFMVWWAEVSARAMGIPSEVMGFTFLAAGTSVPDLITSVLVAKKGFGDMAVSSSIGSNMFDITFGLPFPWVLKSLTTGGDPVKVESKSLLASVMMLIIMLFTTIGCIAFFGWRLNKLLGLTSFLLYVIFVTASLFIEYDVISV